MPELTKPALSGSETMTNPMRFGAVPPRYMPSEKVGTRGLALSVNVCRMSGHAFIEFPFDEGGWTIIWAMHASCHEYGVGFDLDDPDLWENIPGGYRVHGYFLDDVI